MSEQPYLTSEGAARLKSELEHLKGPARNDMAQRLRAAIQMGDLSENADYHKAKEDQAFLEGHIQELEYLLHNAIVVEGSNGGDQVDIGMNVTIQEGDEAPETYYMVGAKEADPRNGKISNESPIGRALMGHRIGEIVTAETPAGQIIFKILNIE